MKMKWYVGLAVTTYALIAFRASSTPTEASGYLAVIGPFRTKRAALWAESMGATIRTSLMSMTQSACRR